MLQSEDDGVLGGWFTWCWSSLLELVRLELEKANKMSVVGGETVCPGGC